MYNSDNEKNRIGTKKRIRILRGCKKSDLNRFRNQAKLFLNKRRPIRVPPPPKN